MERFRDTRITKWLCRKEEKYINKCCSASSSRGKKKKQIFQYKFKHFKIFLQNILQ